MGPGVTVTQKGVPKGRGLARFLQRSGLEAGASWRLAWLERGCSLRESDSSFAVPVATVLEPSEGHSHPRSRALRRRPVVKVRDMEKRCRHRVAGSCQEPSHKRF